MIWDALYFSGYFILKDISLILSSEGSTLNRLKTGMAVSNELI